MQYSVTLMENNRETSSKAEDESPSVGSNENEEDGTVENIKEEFPVEKMKFIEQEEVGQPSNKRSGLRPKRPITFDNLYDHIVVMVLTQLIVSKSIEMCGDRAVEAAMKELKQLDEKSVLISMKCKSLSKV